MLALLFLLWSALFTPLPAPPPGDFTLPQDETRAFTDPTAPDGTRRNQQRQTVGTGHVTVPGQVAL